MKGRKRTVQHKPKGFCRCAECRATRGELNRVARSLTETTQDESEESDDSQTTLPGVGGSTVVRHASLKELLEELEW